MRYLREHFGANMCLLSFASGRLESDSNDGFLVATPLLRNLGDKGAPEREQCHVGTALVRMVQTNRVRGTCSPKTRRQVMQCTVSRFG